MENEAAAPVASAPAEAQPTAPTPGGPAPVDEPRGPSHGVYEDRHAAHDPDVGQFTDTLFALGVPTEVGKAALAWLGSNDNDTAYAQQDASDRQAGIAELRAMWPGDQYAQNIELANRYLDNNLPPGVGNQLAGVRVGGVRLLNIPEAMVKLVTLAKRGAKVPGATGNLETDIRSIESVMRTDPEGYQRDNALQTRLRSLYAQRIAKKSPTQ
jgi:hypothetical protein